jgi:branched-chain amino acid transport system permease protein
VANFIEIAVTGASFGAAFALLALSINVIYSSSNVLNFAQGEFMMVGGMLGWVLYSTGRTPYIVAFVLVALICAIIGVIEYYLVIWPLLRRRAAVISIIVATLGFSIVMRISTALATGGVERFARPPLGEHSVRIIGAALIPQSFVILGVTVVALVGLWLIYSRTTLGMALRAAAFEPDGARLMSIDVSKVRAATFAAGGGLAGIAGLLISPLSFASPWIGLDFAIQGFAAAIVGGLGSWPGSILGGATLGVFRSVMLRYVSPEWGNMFTLGLILLVLFVRPRGLFGERAAEAGPR